MRMRGGRGDGVVDNAASNLWRCSRYIILYGMGAMLRFNDKMQRAA